MRNFLLGGVETGGGAVHVGDMPSSFTPLSARPFPLGERELIAMMALMQALQALAVDAMLPALGQISTELGVSNPNHRQYVVGLFLGGIALGSLIPGPISDRIGRKPVLLGSLILYVVLTAGCALVTEFNAMLAMRTVAGVACAALSVVPAAVIRDRFDGDRMARLQSLIAVIFLTVPMLAPSIGQAILLFAGWRWIFGFMAMMGALVLGWVWLRLPESLDDANRQPIRLRTIATNMSATLTNRVALGYVLGSSFTIGVLWGWVQCCQQLLAEHFGAGDKFPLVFGGMAVLMAVGNFTNSRIVERFGARRVGHSALLAYICVSALQVWLAHQPHETIWQFVPVMALNMMLMGFMGANFASIALQPFARIAGSASSAQSFIRVVVGSIIGLMVGQAYDQTAQPLAHWLLGSALVTLLLVLWSERGRLFRRMIPPGEPRPA